MEKIILEIRLLLDRHNIHHYFDGTFKDANRPLEYYRFAVQIITFDVCQRISELDYVKGIRLVHNSTINQMFLEVTTTNES